MTTLLDLRNRAYALMDEGQSQYLGVAEMNNYVNNAASIFHNIVISESPWRAQQEYTWSPFMGVADYALPPDFRDCLRLFTKQGSFFQALKQFNVSQYGLSANNNVWRQAPLNCYPRYRIMGNKVRLDPAPTVTPSWSLVMWYTPAFTTLVADTDLLPSWYVPGHEQWIVNSACIYAKTKEEVNSQDLQVMNQQIMAQILADLRQRDRGCGNEITPERANDEYSEWL